MQRITDRFEFIIDPAKMDFLSWSVVFVVWLVVVACGVGSVYAHRNRMTSRQRWFWVGMIVCVPVIGLLAYLPVSMVRDGYSILKPAKKDTKKIPASQR